MIAISPYDLLQFQINHYSERFAQAKNTRERSFLRRELHNLKKPPYDCDNDPLGRSADGSLLDTKTDLGCA